MQFDIIIVGGGSAGAVLAGRLSESPALSVCLLEAGKDTPPGNESDTIRDTYYSTLYDPALFWSDLKVQFTAAQREQASRKKYEQARVLGGGSSVNAMIGLRGLPADYDEWGLSGWCWSDVLPYFRKLENDLDFDGPLHGKDGPIPIRRHPVEQWPGFCRAVAAHLETRGWRHVSDMNGPPENGLFPVPMTNTAEHRVSSAMAYLTQSVRARPNLTIICNTTASSILMEGTRAKGVKAMVDDAMVDFLADEVIISAGALHSPALLQRSGIGPHAVLRAAGITPIVDLPGVGANLQDHPMVSVASHLRPAARQPAQLRAAANLGVRYDSSVEGCHPSDMYISVANKGSWHAIGRQIGALVMCLYKPYSRGTVEITSRDFREEPHVNFNLLEDERDELRMMQAVRFAASIYASPELKAVVHSAFPAELSDRVRRLNLVSVRNRVVAALGAKALDGPRPVRDWLLQHVVNEGPGLHELIADESALRAWVREKAVAFYHPVGTCRMGPVSQSSAVVDASGAVHGLQGLRVVDASIMPTIPRANTNLSTIMIAEKISHDIRSARSGPDGRS